MSVGISPLVVGENEHVTYAAVMGFDHVCGFGQNLNLR